MDGGLEIWAERLIHTALAPHGFQQALGRSRLRHCNTSAVTCVLSAGSGGPRWRPPAPPSWGSGQGARCPQSLPLPRGLAGTSTDKPRAEGVGRRR